MNLIYENYIDILKINFTNDRVKNRILNLEFLKK